MTRVAIIGGGPGGLMTAHVLEQKCSCRATLFEASDRLGGKVRTCRFDSAPVKYEAGVAECYDYEAIGDDPLWNLMRELGLDTTPTGSNAIVLDGALMADDIEIGQRCGDRTLRAIEDFRRQAATILPLSKWYQGLEQGDNGHPWARRTFEEMLNEVADPVAKAYLKVAVHSDLATEPNLTNGLNGLRKLLGSVPGYGAQYSIDGGMDMLPRRLAEHLTSTNVVLNAPVVRVSGHGGQEENHRQHRHHGQRRGQHGQGRGQPGQHGQQRGQHGHDERSEGYSISFRQGRRVVEQQFDAVVVALPHTPLQAIEWAGKQLGRAMAEHVAHYNRPGHYLRISVLFDQPFWRRLVSGSWFMLDAFGGCCVYDEGTRHDAGGYGVLGWLLAGADALALCNADDETLIRRALESLPDDLHTEACGRFLEGKVHRWAGAVSGQPGGFPMRDLRSAHQPEPVQHGGLFLVGDYLFDCTLNGVLRSATFAIDLLQRWLRCSSSGQPATPIYPSSADPSQALASNQSR
jgi:monoamine oxidase